MLCTTDQTICLRFLFWKGDVITPGEDVYTFLWTHSDLKPKEDPFSQLPLQVKAVKGNLRLKFIPCRLWSQTEHQLIPSIIQPGNNLYSAFYPLFLLFANTLPALLSHMSMWKAVEVCSSYLVFSYEHMKKKSGGVLSLSQTLALPFHVSMWKVRSSECRAMRPNLTHYMQIT